MLEVKSTFRNSEEPGSFSRKSPASAMAEASSSGASLHLVNNAPETRSGPLAIALVGPNPALREEVSQALTACGQPDHRQFGSYPPSLDDLPRLIEQQYEVIVIDLDHDSSYALSMVEYLVATGACTVMVYSAKTDADLLLRCLRAGAREYLQLPLKPGIMNEALTRAAARRPALSPQKRTNGKLFTFLGAKGGAGVTTLACNFAVSVAKESGKDTLLIDLDLPLGDAALNLGVSAEFSAINALQANARLDASFLNNLLVKHSSGLSVLAAPGRFLQYDATAEAVDRLIAVARQSFEHVIVDLGSRLEYLESSLLREATTIYLVTQTGIPELRNSNRLISQYFQIGGPKVEIVINRYEPRALGVTEEHIEKALTRAPEWKIPNDYAAVRRMQVSASPLTEVNAPIGRMIRKMACTASGATEQPAQKKKTFGLFG